jgi:VWFA-related protein
MDRRATSAVLLLCSLLGCASSVCAQQPLPPSSSHTSASADAGSTLSTTTELVLVPVQVKGSDGRPVLGLKQEEFILKSDKVVQPVRVFEEWNGASKAPAQTVHSPAGTTPKYYSVPEGGMPQQMLIIAIDLVNTPFLDQGRARQQLLKYLSEDLPNQPFALVAITKNGLMQVHPFSSDRKTLEDALKRLQVSVSKDEMQEKAFDITAENTYESMTEAFRESQVYGAFASKIAARTTLIALIQIAQAYAGVPGRKSVIWLTAGMPTLLADPFAGGIHGSSNLNADSDLVDDYYRAFDALNTANIAVYGVNVEGLHGDKTYLATGPAQSLHQPGYNSQTIYGNKQIPVTDEQDDGIKVLSAQTGGKSCTAMTELKTCIDQAVQDSTSYYLLGFYVAQTNRKADWHKLEVKLNSGRGTVHSRSSYYLAPRTAPTQKDINTAMRDAAFAKINYTGFSFTVERLPDDAPGAATAKLRIRVPASSVVTPSGEQKTLQYDIAAVPLTKTGELVTDIHVTHLNFTPEQTENSLSHGWVVNEPSPPLSSAAAVRYVIRDGSTGRIGSVVVPLSSPAKGS